MPRQPSIPVKTIPFSRLLLSLIAGIIFQWYSGVNFIAIFVSLSMVLLFIAVFRFLPLSKRFVLSWLNGIFFLLLFFCLGMYVTWQQNIKHHPDWYGKFYQTNSETLLSIREPLIEKANSYKATASVTAVLKNHSWMATEGEVLLYFKNEKNKPILKYGSQIILLKALHPIQNNGNPGALDYNRYCLFNDITAQAFLSSKDYVILSNTNKNPFQQVLFNIRDWALNVLKQNIHSPKELGIAEALLIGYRNDLDKDLVQAYSNTGVVHIIAISGLHIGVIYAALIFIFSLFKSFKIKKWLEPITVLFIIWAFTLIAGAAPSVLRATVMFTFILSGKILRKNTNIYNTLSSSAFFLLIINPFYLWDVGFQLSYMAVLSIVIFYKPVNNLLYFKNRLLRWVWQLSAISLSAQVFTMPLVVYHFHQLPFLFLFGNLVAVPLSGLILLEELFLFCFAWWHEAAAFAGRVTEICLYWMNKFVEHMNEIAFSVWDGLHISLAQFLLMFIIIGCLSYWVFYKRNNYFFAAITGMILFFVARDMDIFHHKLQQKLIVYNIPGYNAADIITGDHYVFTGDSIVLKDVFLRNFNLKPARIKNRVYHKNDYLLPFPINHIFIINKTKLLVLGKSVNKMDPQVKMGVNVLILTNEFNQTPAYINIFFKCDYIVAGSSVPVWKSAKWKKEFEQLHLRFYSVAQNGAFTLKL